MRIAAASRESGLTGDNAQAIKRIPARSSSVFGQGLEQFLQVGEFAGSVNRGMRRKNLFHE